MNNTNTNNYNIRLNTANDIKEVVYAATDYAIKGYIAGNKTEVAITSILGLFSLDMTQPHIVKVRPNPHEANFVRRLRESNIEITPA